MGTRWSFQRLLCPLTLETLLPDAHLSLSSPEAQRPPQSHLMKGDDVGLGTESH